MRSTSSAGCLTPSTTGSHQYPVGVVRGLCTGMASGAGGIAREDADSAKLLSSQRTAVAVEVAIHRRIVGDQSHFIELHREAEEQREVVFLHRVFVREQPPVGSVRNGRGPIRLPDGDLVRTPPGLAGTLPRSSCRRCLRDPWHRDRRRCGSRRARCRSYRLFAWRAAAPKPVACRRHRTCGPSDPISRSLSGGPTACDASAA